MTTDALTLSQLLSPNFPVGAFAYSHGLEMAVDDGFISNSITLEAWLIDLLEFGTARSDAVILNTAYGSNDPTINATARAFATSAERLMETDLQGRAFCDTVLAVWGHNLGQLCYPVAVGQIAYILELDVELTTAMYLQAFIANLTTAATRLLKIGQIDCQKIQLALKPHCIKIATSLRGATLEDLHNSTWLSDIEAMRHEKQYSRIFRS